MPDLHNPSSMRCDCCRSGFHPQAASWGSVCGDCIAARLELLLWRTTLGFDAGRKPMRRATDLVPATVDVERRRA